MVSRAKLAGDLAALTRDAEVAEIVEVPLAALFDPAARGTTRSASLANSKYVARSNPNIPARRFVGNASHIWFISRTLPL